MATPLLGAGYLRVIDLLQKASYLLIEPVVDFALNAPVAAGLQTVPQGDPSIYVGAKLVVGVTGTDLEVVTVTAATSSSFTAVFLNNHAAGDRVLGATFPVRYPTDPLFTQEEMIGYLSKAMNDFLTDAPLVINVADLSAVPTAQNVALPADAHQPVRVASQNYPLRETSQSNLDSMNPSWNLAGLAQPKVYFRDKVPVQNIGLWPRAGNMVNLQVAYEQRQATTMDWGDGFLLPDPYLIYPFYRTISFAYSKDGEMRNPGLAKYFQDRYDTGVKIANMILDVVNDPNA